MFNSKIDKLVHFVGIYTITSFTLKVVTKTVKGVAKELEIARKKEEAKSDRDILDMFLAELNEEEKATLDKNLLNLWKSMNNVDFIKKTED